MSFLAWPVPVLQKSGCARHLCVSTCLPSSTHRVPARRRATSLPLRAGLALEPCGNGFVLPTFLPGNHKHRGQTGPCRGQWEGELPGSWRGGDSTSKTRCLGLGKGELLPKGNPQEATISGVGGEGSSCVASRSPASAVPTAPEWPLHAGPCWGRLL